jgi:RHS repeat-associated protein
VLTSVAVGYARRVPAFDEQSRTLATLTESRYTNPILGDDAYRTPLPAEVKTFELTAPALAGAQPLGFAAVDTIAAAAGEIAYEAQSTPGQTEKRLIAQLRTLYRKNDLSALLPVGKIESMALPGESYKLALTLGLLDIFQLKASRAELIAPLTGSEGGYCNLDGNGRLWISSGRAFYSADPGDMAPQERAFAQANFFLPHRYRDPFGNNAFVSYDPKYTLLLVATRDAVGNQTSAEQDYRVLQPRMVTDPNGNRTEARFDALGMLAATALRGKAAGPVEGDSFDAFATDLTPQQVQDFFDSTHPRALAVTHLGTATTRILYDLEHVPVCAASIARESHVSDLAPGSQTKVQLHFVYSDGFGREAQTKVQAEPGPLDLADPESPIANPRWVGTGEKIYNNKGKPVRQYEPFFSATPQFAIEKWGVSSTLFYDPVERVVATLHPNHTFEKVAFDPWRQTVWDVNDTVTFDPKNDPHVGEFFSRLPDAEYLSTWYQQRINNALGPEEQRAAEKAAKHADTPTATHLDTLGRIFLTIADNGKDANGLDQKYQTRTVLDIEGNQREVVDALDRTVMRYDYDMLGTRIHQTSMEAGARWMLRDATGKPIRAWDSRSHTFRTEYDALRRPVRSFVIGVDPQNPATEILFARTEYGEGQTDDIKLNLRTKPFRQYDCAGLATTEAYDFKGNPLRTTRRLAQDYKMIPDWSAALTLERETFASATAYDALNRPVTVTTPDASVYRSTYNEANLLERVDVNLQGASTATSFVANVDYNAKGQRTRIDYGNGASTLYTYDEQTFRLTKLLTQRNPTAFPGDCPNPPPAGWAGCQAQNLSYTYDSAGNITHIRDDAQQTIYFSNKRVEPSADYIYDAVDRLIQATGREHLGQNKAPVPQSYNDAPRAGIDWSANDGNAMGNYVERYVYDPVGNFQQIEHTRSDASAPRWTRGYAYNEPSQIEPGRVSNRLSSTTVGEGTPVTATYTYDDHGNMLRMPQLQIMQYDFRDQLQMSQRQAVNADDADGLQHQGERTCYVYDAAGQRVRKVTERQAAGGKAPTRMNERIYFDGYEIYREYGADGTTVTMERQTLHVIDDKQRIALVETRTKGTESAPRQLIRYQFGNHLGSASLELCAEAQIISYEEYYPYGSTSYQAGRSAAGAALKRFRYTGMERDKETGLNYHGARYYSAWLGRWVCPDPHYFAGGLGLYNYAHLNPMKYSDQQGKVPSEIGNLLKEIQLLFQRNMELVSTLGLDPKAEGRLGAWLTEGKINDLFVDPATQVRATQVRYAESISSRISIDIKVPVEGRLAIDLKRSSTSIRLPQLIGHQRNAEEEGHLLAYVSRDEIKIWDYSGKFTKDELQKIRNVASRIRIERTSSVGRTERMLSQSEGIAYEEELKETVKTSGKAKLPKAKVVKGASKVVKEEASTIAKILKVSGKVAKPVVKTAIKAAPIIGTGANIGEGIYHLSEGRYGRAAVDFAEAIPVLGDAILAVDLAVQLLDDGGPRSNPVFDIDVEPANPYPTGGQWGDPTVN